jgi:hypothetical protein
MTSCKRPRPEHATSCGWSSLSCRTTHNPAFQARGVMFGRMTITGLSSRCLRPACPPGRAVGVADGQSEPVPGEPDALSASPVDQFIRVPRAPLAGISGPVGAAAGSVRRLMPGRLDICRRDRPGIGDDHEHEPAPFAFVVPVLALFLRMRSPAVIGAGSAKALGTAAAVATHNVGVYTCEAAFRCRHSPRRPHGMVGALAS